MPFDASMKEGVLARLKSDKCNRRLSSIPVVGYAEAGPPDGRAVREDDVPSEDQSKYLPDTSLDLLTDLAGVLDAVGQPTFYETLAASVAKFLDSNRFLALRYAMFAKPKFLVNQAMTAEAVDRYLKNYYRIDPILRMVHEGSTKPVVTFDELRRDGADTLFYNAMYQTADIRDELGFLMPTVGGVYTALCVDRGRRCFSEVDVLKARLIFPTLTKLHQLHLNRSLFDSVGGNSAETDLSMIILDEHGKPAFRSTRWSRDVGPDLEGEVLRMSRTPTKGSRSISQGLVCHWEPLDAMNAVAPNGIAITIEKQSPGYVDLSSTALVQQFAAAYDLTPREAQIVELVLEGEPGSSIAERLGVSAGTIRNHKHRLYYKLDITTERELFRMIFDLITS